MTGPTKVVQVASPGPDHPDGWTEAAAAEAERWRMFGDIVAQQQDPSTGRLLTDVEVTRHGYRALRGALERRPDSALLASVTDRDAHA